MVLASLCDNDIRPNGVVTAGFAIDKDGRDMCLHLALVSATEGMSGYGWFWRQQRQKGRVFYAGGGDLDKRDG